MFYIFSHQIATSLNNINTLKMRRIYSYTHCQKHTHIYIICCNREIAYRWNRSIVIW